LNLGALYFAFHLSFDIDHLSFSSEKCDWRHEVIAAGQGHMRSIKWWIQFEVQLAEIGRWYREAITSQSPGLLQPWVN